MEVPHGMEFWEQLRHRKLFQWAAAYLAGAWLVMQAVDVVGGHWTVPVALQRGIDVVLLVGFFVALTLAWYHGERGRQRVSGPELLILAMLFVVCGIGLSFLRVEHPSAEEAVRPAIDDGTVAALGRLPGLVVLPFANRSGVPEDQYFTDGIYDDLLTRLQRIPDLRVISRTSAETYRGTDKTIPIIGSELAVSYVLEGGVQRAGDRVRVNLQLIDARNEGHLWAEMYDRVLTPHEVFDTQSEIVRTVAAELGIVLAEEETSRAARRSTEDPEAYDLYARARDAYEHGDVRRAEDLLRQATEREPGFLGAQFLLVVVSGRLYQYFGDRTAERAALVRTAAERAVELDPESPDAQLAMGIYLYRVPKDYAGALEWLRRASGTLRGDFTYQYYRALCERRMGRWQQSVESMQAARSLSPRDRSPVEQLGLSLLNMRRYDAAEQVVREGIETWPEEPSFYFRLDRVAWRRNGDTDPWRANLQRFRSPLRQFELGMVLGDPAGALAALQEADDEASQDADVWYPKPMLAAFAWELLGDAKRAVSSFRQAAAVLEPLVAASHNDERYHGALALTYAGLGQRDAALREALTAAELLPWERDALAAPSHLFSVAVVHARFGEADEAVAVLEQLLTHPSQFSAATLRNHYMLRPVWNEPAFLELLEREPGRVF